MRWQLWLVACGIGGLITGLAWPPPPIPRPQKDDASWFLPAQDQVARYSGDVYQQARQGVTWSGDSGNATQAAWQLAGLVFSPAPTALILRLDNSTIEHAQPGDTLPDGSTLQKVEGNRIEIRQDNCQLVYQLHYKEPVSASAGCPTSTTPVDDAEKRKRST